MLYRIAIIAIDEVLPYVVMKEPLHGRRHLKKRPKRIYNGHAVKMDSLRYQTFVNSGTICVGCGLEASYFALERHINGKKAKEAMDDQEAVYHLNLYGLHKDKEVLFTKDHIIPRCRGGKNVLDNLQTMCSICNNHKGEAPTVDAGRAVLSYKKDEKRKKLGGLLRKIQNLISKIKVERKKVYQENLAFGGPEYIKLNARYKHLVKRVIRLQNALTEYNKSLKKEVKYSDLKTAWTLYRENLINQMQTGSTDETIVAAKILAQQANKTTISALMQILKITNDCVVRNAIAVILKDMLQDRKMTKQFEETANLLIELIEDPRTQGARGTLLYALEIFDYSPFISTLMNLAATKGYEVSIQASRMLRRLEMKDKLPHNWIYPVQDTDCEFCFYTIHPDDEEGIFSYKGKFYCTESCAAEHHQLVNEQVVDEKTIQ